MKDVFAKLTADFLSAAVFFILYIATDDVVLATAAARDV
ncbi:MAG: intracellular septation protein, partial [Bradyrhizobium sp.]|nr:intracellular septation protein [Bradyrhizobium sp.]